MTFRAAGLGSAAVLATALAACSSTSEPAAPAATPDAAPADPGTTPDAGETPDAAPSACAPPPSKSDCGDAAWVRGVAHFDPALLTPASKPVLRVVLRHSFIVLKGEETIGGRLHEWKSFPVTDPSTGVVPFAIDMCGSGTSMWSEENGAFHLVLILDENGDNDLDNATSNDDAIVMGTPTKGEHVKMMDVDVSCKGTSACVDAKLDCVGAACLAFQPVKSCAKKLPGCSSDSAFCK